MLVKLFIFVEKSYLPTLCADLSSRPHVCGKPYIQTTACLFVTVIIHKLCAQKKDREHGYRMRTVKKG